MKISFSKNKSITNRNYVKNQITFAFFYGFAEQQFGCYNLTRPRL